jgi:hypothetical protein
MIETLAVFLGMAYLAATAAYESHRRWWLLISAMVLGVLAALVKVTTFGVFLAGAWLLVAARRSAEWRRLRAWLLALAVLATITLPAVVLTVCWNHYLDGIKALNPLTNYTISTSASQASWLFGTLAERMDPATWQRIFERITMREYPPALLVACVAGLAVARRRWLAVGVALLLFLCAPAVFTNLHFVHTYYACANLIFFVVAVGLCAAALLECPDWRRWLGGGLVLAVIGCSVYRHQTVYADSQRFDGWPIIAPARAVERVTGPEEVILGCGLDWSPEIPYYARRRALLFPQWATAAMMEEQFRRLADYKIGAAVVSVQPVPWEGAYAKQFRDRLAENLKRLGLSRLPSFTLGSLWVFPGARFEPACQALWQGKQYRAKKELVAALSALDKAVASLPDEPEPYLERGLCRLAGGRIDSGLEDLEKALARNPREPNLLLQAGQAYLAAGRAAAAGGQPNPAWLLRALELIDTVVTIAPDAPAAYQARGAICQALGRNEDAAGDQQTAERLEKNR